MKAIILAAGLGSRLGSATNDTPKGMLLFQGKPLLQWQIESLKSAGIEDITIITGHCASCINFPDIKYVHNPLYASTNMLESLFCAREELKDGFILSYADIVYVPELVRSLISSPAHIGVAADVEWKRYWMHRFGALDLDLESFSVDKNGVINELGKEVDSPADITHRYVGLLKFSPIGAKWLIETYDQKRREGTAWKQSGKEFEQGYITDIINLLIESGREIHAVETVNGWLEFDEPSDFEMANSLVEKGEINELCRIIT